MAGAATLGNLGMTTHHLSLHSLPRPMYLHTPGSIFSRHTYLAPGRCSLLTLQNRRRHTVAVSTDS